MVSKHKIAFHISLSILTLLLAYGCSMTKKELDKTTKEVKLVPFKGELSPFNFYGQIEIEEDIFRLIYTVEGDISQINFDHLTDKPLSNRVIGLWQSTCFEFFLRTKNTQKENEYIEFNFSPNNYWNSFHFTSLRGDLKEYEEIKAIEIKKQILKNKYILVVEFKRQDLPHNFSRIDDLEFSMTGILRNKETNQESFWAIKHQGSKPDFHHPGSYIKF